MRHCILFLHLICALGTAAAQSMTVFDLPVKTSIRGMAVVDTQTIWISGSNGYFGVTHDGGRSWNMQQVPDYDSAEFRDIEVFSDGSMLLMSSTAPAAILRSTDTGRTWSQVFRSDNPAYFLDAMDFHGEHGMCLGDPVDGHFLTLYSHDAGRYWEKRFLNERTDSLAAFAASGSVVQFLTKKHIVFATGGAQARAYYTRDKGITWQYQQTDITQGAPSTGIFSLAVCDRKTLIAAGGDYLQPKGSGRNLDILHYRDQRWSLSEGAEYDLTGGRSLGYISGIACGPNDILVACGTSGAAIISNTYTLIADKAFNVVQFAPKSNTCFLAGNSIFGVYTLNVKR